jgi:hypothetical protein
MKAERREFEEWFASDMMPLEADWFKTDDVTGYTHTATAYAWEGWRARAATAHTLLVKAGEALAKARKILLESEEATFDFMEDALAEIRRATNEAGK